MLFKIITSEYIVDEKAQAWEFHRSGLNRGSAPLQPCGLHDLRILDNVQEPLFLILKMGLYYLPHKIVVTVFLRIKRYNGIRSFSA